METIYERLQRLYCDGTLTEKGLDNAVRRGWITAEQKQDIMIEAEEGEQK